MKRMTAERFKKIRVDLGLSQREMFIALGVKRGGEGSNWEPSGIIKSWEKGKKGIPKPVAKLAWELLMKKEREDE